VGRVVSDLRSIQKRSFVITIKDKIGLYVAKIGASAAATAASWKTSLRLLYELVAKYWQNLDCLSKNRVDRDCRLFNH